MSPNPQLTLFVSDIHLSEDNPPLTQLFLKFIESITGKAAALYILGDLFEAWLGDDDDSPLAKLIAAHLHHLSQDGTRLYLMRGNRDILLGEKFAARCGAVLLNDPTVVDLYGTPTLLMHGDSLCTLDIPHQKYRNLTLNPWIRCFFLNLPLRLRKKIASYLRGKSKVHQRSVLDAASSTVSALSAVSNYVDILDVNPAEIPKVLNQHQVTQLIHGHTHKPKIHHVKDDVLESPATRFVLGDWNALGSVLICTPNNFELQAFSS